MSTTTAPPRPQAEHAPEIPARNLPPVPYRDLPDAPPLRKVLGPSVILVGVGIATGEYILWPYISSQVGLVFLWAVPLGVLMQYFINMEIERYTLATGETAVAGFIRMWKPSRDWWPTCSRSATCGSRGAGPSRASTRRSCGRS